MSLEDMSLEQLFAEFDRVYEASEQRQADNEETLEDLFKRFDDTYTGD